MAAFYLQQKLSSVCNFGTRGHLQLRREYYWYTEDLDYDSFPHLKKDCNRMDVNFLHGKKIDTEASTPRLPEIDISPTIVFPLTTE